MNQQYGVLRKIGSGIYGLIQLDHHAIRYRSRLWFILPVLFNLPGGIISYLAIRHDDPDKAKNCLLVSIILIMPLVITLVAMVAVGEALFEEFD